MLQVDVIVNTAPHDLQLQYGTLSSAILRAAGERLQKECDRRKPTYLPPGDVFSTGGGKLKCRKIYHGHLLRWEHGSNKHAPPVCIYTEALQDIAAS